MRRSSSSPFRSLGVVAALTLTLAACNGAGGGASTDTATANGGGGAETVVAIATTTQLGDITNQIATCAGSSATTLMGVGDDPHDFAVSSAQIAEMTRVPLVVMNGLGLEAGMTSAIENAVADGAHVLEVAPLANPIPFEAADHAADADADAHADETASATDDHGHADPHDHTGDDPHFWHDASRMAIAAKAIGAELANTTGNEMFDQCGSKVATQLEELHLEVTKILDVVPAERRFLVTDHEALGYFADAYNFTLAGVVIPGGSTNAEPSSQELAALVAEINKLAVPAIFSNNAATTSLIEAVASEVGDVQVVELFEGSLGAPGSGAETYQGMMRLNAQLIADALS